MIRFFLPLYLFALLTVTPSAGEDAVPLAKVTVNLDKLKDWGTKRYTYRLLRAGNKSGEVLGTYVLRTELADNRVILKDEIALTFNGKRLSGTTILNCRRDNYLSPLRIESKGEGDDGLRNFVAIVDKGRATVTEKGRDRIVDLPEDTVTLEALWRLVTLVPGQNGTRISFGHSLETSELNLKKDFLLESLGEDTIARDYRELRCTKFQLTAKQIRPMNLWVRDGILERIFLDGRKQLDRDDSDMTASNPEGS